MADSNDALPTAISSELLDAYSATIFVVHSEPQLQIRIGTSSIETDLFLASHGA